MNIFWLIVLACVILYIYLSWNQKRVPKNTITLFTGGLGSGKTFMAVKCAIKRYQLNMIYWLINKISLGVFCKKFKDKPDFYSNIPVRVWLNRWAKILRYEHLVQTERLPENVVIIIDEIGSIFDQYAHDHPLVRVHFEPFLRFFRHFTDGYIFATDQNSSNIVVGVRRRINTIYNLSDFKRSWFFFYHITVQEVHFTEDILTIQDTTKYNELPYFFGFLPFKFMSIFGLKPRYDSRCYSGKYKALFSKDDFIWDQYKTEYVIELPDSKKMRSEFRIKGFISKNKMLEYIDEWKKRDQDNDGVSTSKETIKEDEEV